MNIQNLIITLHKGDSLTVKTPKGEFHIGDCQGGDLVTVSENGDEERGFKMLKNGKLEEFELG